MINYIIVDDEVAAHSNIEDYASNLKNLKLLKNCYNAFEAISFLNSNQVDLIFLDINMPIVDGWEFLEEYSQLANVVKQSIKLYMVTSSVIQSDIDKAKDDQNIIDFVSKPITNDQLKNMLQ